MADEAQLPAQAVGGGRSWWAHIEFTRMNTTPTILRKKVEDLHEVGASTSFPNRLACAADD